jgi:hypothetical protein
MSDNLKALSERAALRLVGSPVIVELRKPGVKGRNGQALRVGNKLIIQIDPQAGDLLHIILHELAHCKLHKEGLPGFSIWALAPQSKQLGGLEVVTGTRIHPGVDRQEQEADKLAAEWEAYALKHGADHLETQLEALTGYLEPRLQAMIDKAAQRAHKLFTGDHR